MILSLMNGRERKAENMSADITTIILTKNEENNIKLCIDSIKSIVKRIIVIDSFSTDKTVEIAKQLGAEVYQHTFENYSKQFKYGLYNFEINTKWVLRLDADESLTKESGVELEKLCNENENTNVNGIIVRFEVDFMGKKLKHGGIYPFKKLLAFKYGIGDIEDRHMDEHIVLSQGEVVEMKNDSLHRSYKNLQYWINKMNWYSSREVFDYYDQTKHTNSNLDRRASLKRFIKFNIYYKLPLGLRAKLYYIYRYYFKLGFLDGTEGKIQCFFGAYFYRYLVDAKIYESQVMDTMIEYSKGLNDK